MCNGNKTCNIWIDLDLLQNKKSVNAFMNIKLVFLLMVIYETVGHE